MKSICVFSNTLMNSGAEKQAFLLNKTLNEIFNVWLVVYYGNRIEQKYLDIIKKHNLKAIFLSGSHLNRCVHFYKFLKRESIDIIFSYLLTTNFIGGLIGKIAGVKYTIGGIRNSELSKKKLFIQKILHNHINNFTIYNNNRGFKELSLKGFKNEKSLVISNCIDLIPEPILRIKRDHITILSVGRFEKPKDFYTSIKAVNFLRDKFQKFTYLIIGYGRLQNQIHEWIKSFNAADYIKVIINPKNLSEYYEMANIYLLTSRFEGLSNTVLEAMSFSLPLVVTDVGDNNKLVVDEVNGFLCDPQNSNQISGCLQKLCLSYERRIDFGKRSYELLKENYSNKDFKNRYTNFIDGLKV